MCIDRPPVGTDHVVRDILLDLTAAVHCDARVLITGDGGPGKKEIAQIIHQASRRATSRFVTVDCASMTESELERKLFGCARSSVHGRDRDTAA